MFSGRLPRSLTPNETARVVEAKRQAGVPLLDLTGSNPTRAGFTYPAELLEAFRNPRALVYEPSPRGLETACEMLAARHGVAPDRVLLTASTSESYSFLFKLLADPGDEVLVPRPSYPLFECLAELECVRLAPYPLEFRGGAWRIDFDALAAAVNPRARALLVVNPNNPAGSFLKPDELPRLVELCAARGMALVSDEVFSPYAFGPGARVETLAHVGEVLTFTLHGLSKEAGLPQMKLGWMIVAGPEPVRREAAKRLEWIADAYLSVSTPVQHALPALLEEGAAVRERILARVKRNYEWLLTAAAPLPVEGGWYAVLPVDDEDRALDWLLHQDVLVQPGFFYDFPREGFVVVSLLTPEEVFREGVRRIR